MSFPFSSPLCFGCLTANVSNSAIELQSLSKKFGAVMAVDRVSLAIAPGEFFSLLGPSGCGKTTLLRLIGGFEEPDAGEIFISGRAMRGVPPQRRPVNTVFQNYALFPHLDVFENVAFGLRMKRISASELRRRVEAVLDLTHIADLRHRSPSQLSGGQKQRVALARAIVNEPAVLLLDEPLAALDAKLRAQLQTELRNLQRELKTTFVYVTHDQDEALALSDRIAILQSGRLAQCGTPAEIYEHPRTRFVASFIGASNILDARVISSRNGLVTVETSIGQLTTAAKIDSEAVSLSIRREDLIFSSKQEGPNLIRGTILDRAYTGPQTEYGVEVKGTILRVWEPRSAVLRSIGETVTLTCAPESILVLEDK
jgi:spermidine/putrescine transport system ATP-binding protein